MPKAATKSRPSSTEYTTIEPVATPDVEALAGPFSGMSMESAQTSRSPVGDVPGSSGQQRNPAKPTLTRGQSQIQQALTESAKFVGIYDVSEAEPERSRWNSKRIRFLSKNYNCDPKLLAREAEQSFGHADQPYYQFPEPALDSPATALQSHLPERSMAASSTPVHFSSMRSQSTESRPRLERKDSAIKVVFNMASSLLKRGTTARPKKRDNRSSFDADGYFDSSGSVGMTSASLGGITTPHLAQTGTHITHDIPATRHFTSPIPEETSTEMDDAEPQPSQSMREGGSVDAGTVSRPSNLAASSRARGMTKSATVAATSVVSDRDTSRDADDESSALRMPMPRPRRCLMQIGKASGPIRFGSDVYSTLSDDVFDTPISAAVRTEVFEPDDLMDYTKNADFKADLAPLSHLDMGSSTLNSRLQPVQLGGPLDGRGIGDEPTVPDRFSFFAHAGDAGMRRKKTLEKQDAVELVEKETTDGGPAVAVPEPDEWEESRKKHYSMMGVIIENLASTGMPPRRSRGVGVLGRLFNHKVGRNKVRELSAELRKKIEDGENDRPLFTYWVTTVQIIVCIVSIAFYGFGPVGFGRVEQKRQVLDTSLAERHVAYHEPSHFWLGPKFADLIRLGAKYSPCMRRERGVWQEIERDRVLENQTACCVFNDRSGCYQTGETSCPRSHATWVKWGRKSKSALKKSKSDSNLLSNLNTTFHRHQLSVPEFLVGSSRTAGSVCGQDPEFCVVPASVDPYEWPDDLTKWPVCLERRTEGAMPTHMTCQMTGRPCCIQLQGRCRIATKEYCEFVQGHWHENATLCSQVDCFSDICGMIPFIRQGYPDQAYRLFLSLFVHAGLLHLAISVVFQLYFMRDLEIMIGWFRMALLYIISGVGGNLAAAIFVPYSPDVGPSGSQLGVIAALLVDLIHHRSILDHWKQSARKYAGVVFFLFLLGLLPWMDNWAHLFGFVFGLLVTIITFPYLDFSSGRDDTKKKRGFLALYRRHITVFFCITACTLLFFSLGYVFFSNVPFDCQICEYFNCINIKLFTGDDHFCDNNGHRLTQWLPI